jgi:hypothetical protein
MPTDTVAPATVAVTADAVDVLFKRVQAVHDSTFLAASAFRVEGNTPAEVVGTFMPDVQAAYEAVCALSESAHAGGAVSSPSWLNVETADITAVGRAMVELLRREEERPGINMAYRAALVAARTALDHVCRCFW